MTNDQLNVPGYEIPEELQHSVSITTLDRLYNWGRRSSVWPMMLVPLNRSSRVNSTPS